MLRQKTSHAEALFPALTVRAKIRCKYLIPLVQSGGIEPPTSGSTIRRSNQLSYDCTVSFGGRKLWAAPGKSKPNDRLNRDINATGPEP